MNEHVLEAFSELGFVLESMGELGYGFNYEGTSYLYMMPVEDDDSFLSLAIPCIYDSEEAGELPLSALTERINSEMKFVKSFQCNGSVWLFYEWELLGGEEMQAVIAHMILHLDAAFTHARQIAKSMEQTGTPEAHDGIDESDEDIVENLE